MDWSSIDWVLVRKISVDSWWVTVIVCTIAWLIAWSVGLVIRKSTKTTTTSKEEAGKGN